MKNGGIMKRKSEPWSKEEILSLTIGTMLLFSIFGYAVWSYIPKEFETTFTVKKSMPHININHYTQVITTNGLVFYLYDYPVFEVGKTYSLKLISRNEPLNGVTVYNVLGS